MTSGHTIEITEWSRGEGLVMRSRGRADLTRRALVGSLTLALANGCSRPAAGGDEAGDGTTGDTGTPADLDGGTTGDEPVEFPEVVGTWVESRHVAGAAYVPSPEDPPPPCFGDFCFETFFCGVLDRGTTDGLRYELKAMPGHLQIRQFRGDVTRLSDHVLARVPAGGGNVEGISLQAGVSLTDPTGTPFNGANATALAVGYVAAPSSDLAYYPDDSHSGLAYSAGDEVRLSYMIADIIAQTEGVSEWDRRQWVGEQRVWYGGIGEDFFSVDLGTGERSEPNVHLAEFVHSGSPDQRLSVFRELLDGRLVLLRVDETSTCGIDDPCESRWSIVVMDPDTGEIDEILGVNDGPTITHQSPELVGDVDDQLVVLESPYFEDPQMGVIAGMYVISIVDGTRAPLVGGEGRPAAVLDEDREVMVYGAKDGRVYVYDVDTGGAQEWFDLSPGSDEGPAFGWWGVEATIPFSTYALVGGRLFVTYPRTDPAPCIYVADLP